MKIKTVNKLNLHELIKHVWENKVYPSVWKSEESPSDEWTIQFFEDGMFRSYNGFHDYDTFTVEVDEELTEDTILPDVSFVYYASITEQVKTIIFSSEQMPTINGITGRFSSTLPLAIYYKDIPIWTSEHGIPADGVLEVSE